MEAYDPVRRPLGVDQAAFRNSLKTALSLARKVDGLLARPPDRLDSAVLLRVRLAYALVLAVVEQLEDLVSHETS